MARVKLYLGVVILSLVALLTGACTGQLSPDLSPIPPDTIKPVSREESQRIAEKFLRNSPTFVFDGISETLRLADTLTARCPYCWTFIFEFKSRHAGYGDRTGQVLAQVITPHKAVVSVEQGEIKSAVMDNKWDMIKQKMLETSEHSGSMTAWPCRPSANPHYLFTFTFIQRVPSFIECLPISRLCRTL